MNEKLNKFVEVKNYVADFLFTNVKTEISVEKLRRDIPAGTVRWDFCGGRIGQVHKGCNKFDTKVTLRYRSYANFKR
ncbi:MAG TPA: hypothetical protein PKA77_13975 [Chitinophagaceae bacterium]|jgi:hypothetical protein|nr:hypothetical protein [Chitinophagaceae bacterium]HMU59474.1 hypothetical protein [Chitinophagaceae bacterium]